MDESKKRDGDRKRGVQQRLRLLDQRIADATFTLRPPARGRIVEGDAKRRVSDEKRIAVRQAGGKKMRVGDEARKMRNENEIPRRRRDPRRR